MKVYVGCDSCVHRNVCELKKAIRGAAKDAESMCNRAFDKAMLKLLVLNMECKHYSLSRTLNCPVPPKPR